MPYRTAMGKDTKERLLPDTTLWSLLTSAVERFGDRSAVIVADSDFHGTYRSLQERAEAASAGLLELGVEPEDRIALWAENLNDWPVFFHAAARVGVVVPILPAAPRSHVEHILRTVGASTLIMGPGRRGDRMALAMEMMPALRTADASALWDPAFKKLGRVVVLSDDVPSGAYPGNRLTAASAEARAALSKASDDSDTDAAVLFCAGTTCTPRGAIASHRALTGAGRAVAQNLELDEEERILLPISFSSLGGLSIGVAAAAWAGAAVIPLFTAEPRRILLAMADMEPTLLVVNATQLASLVSAMTADRTRSESLRTVLVFGSIGRSGLLRRAQEAFGDAAIVQAYGLAETAGVIAAGIRRAPPEERMTRVGKLFPSVEAKLVEPDSGAQVKIGESGELMLRGASVTRDYWGRDEPLPADAEGFVATGDLVSLDADGSLRVIGRLADRIHTAAGPVDPRELEDFLTSKDRIDEAAVVGIPGDDGHELVAVAVRLQPECEMSERDLLLLSEGKLSAHKQPARAFFVDAMPIGPSGEVLRRDLRELLAERIAAEAAEDGDTPDDADETDSASDGSGD